MCFSLGTFHSFLICHGRSIIVPHVMWIGFSKYLKHYLTIRISSKASCQDITYRVLEEYLHVNKHSVNHSNIPLPLTLVQQPQGAFASKHSWPLLLCMSLVLSLLWWKFSSILNWPELPVWVVPRHNPSYWPSVQEGIWKKILSQAGIVLQKDILLSSGLCVVSARRGAVVFLQGEGVQSCMPKMFKWVLWLNILKCIFLDVSIPSLRVPLLPYRGPDIGVGDL